MMYFSVADLLQFLQKKRDEGREWCVISMVDNAPEHMGIRIYDVSIVAEENGEKCYLYDSIGEEFRALSDAEIRRLNPTAEFTQHEEGTE